MLDLVRVCGLYRATSAAFSGRRSNNMCVSWIAEICAARSAILSCSKWCCCVFFCVNACVCVFVFLLVVVVVVKYKGAEQAMQYAAHKLNQ